MQADSLSDTLSPSRVFGADDPSTTAKLIRKRFERSALELLAVIKVLRGRGLERIAEAEFLLRSLPTSQFGRVWSAPDAYFWTRLAYGFAKHGLKDNVVAKFADWNGLTAETFERGLIDRVMLIALSGQALAGNVTGLDRPVRLPRTGSMAGSSIAWTLGEDLWVFGSVDGRLLAGTTSESARPLDSLNFPGVLHMPEITGVGINVDVWSESVRADFPGLEQNKRVNDFSDLQLQTKVLENAFAAIRSTSSTSCDEISLVLRTVTPLRNDGRSFPSSSNSAITGAMWYSQTDVPELLAEMIVHEFSHSKVFLVQDLDPLIDRNVHGTGWDTCEFYSPWRDDPRPLNGIFHGYLVFSEAALFWARRIQNGGPIDGELACRRFGMLVRQIELARMVLERHCRFTQVGRAVMDYFADRLSYTLLPLTVEWNTDARPVLRLERHTEFEFCNKETIAASVASHQERWETRYGSAGTP